MSIISINSIEDAAHLTHWIAQERGWHKEATGTVRKKKSFTNEKAISFCFFQMKKMRVFFDCTDRKIKVALSTKNCILKIAKGTKHQAKLSY